MTHDEYFPGSIERLRAWRHEQRPICWVCLYDWEKFNGDLRRPQVHHIERKGLCYQRSKPDYKHVECNLFFACETCHASVLDSMPHYEQLAYKLKYDPEHYDLQMWLHCRDGPVLRDYVAGNERVTQLEVDAALKSIEGE